MREGSLGGLSPQPPDAVERVGGQDVHAGEEEGAVRNGEEQIVEGAVDAPRRIVERGPADGRRQQGAFAGEAPLAVPMRVAGPAVAVGKAVGEHALDPALQDGRQAEPPERKLKDHGVRRRQLLLLGGDVGRLRAARIGVPRLGHEREPRGVAAIEKVVLVEGGLPAHRVQIRHDDAVAELAQVLDGDVFERAVERRPVGVSVYDENRLAHGDLRALEGRGVRRPALGRAGGPSVDSGAADSCSQSTNIRR